jgi:protein-tyrosine kinase
MGKMLDILRQGEGSRAIPAPVIPLPSREPASAILEMKPQAETAEEEFPYIEVGRPDRKIDASPNVLAIPAVRAPASRPKPAEADSEPQNTRPKPVTAPLMQQVRPLSVSFEPWPGKNQAARYVAPEVIAFHQPEHPASKQYAELFQNISEGLDKSPVLIFLGAGEKSGTTTVLLNLAFSGCRTGQRVALVEGNACRPALAERLGLAAAPGWHEFLAGEVGLEKALSQTAEPRLVGLTAGAKYQGREVISAEALRWVLGWLRERYDLILIDGPELANATEMPALLSAADGAYLVLPQNAPEAGRLGEMTQSIVRMGGRLRGLIHTQFETL